MVIHCGGKRTEEGEEVSPFTFIFPSPPGPDLHFRFRFGDHFLQGIDHRPAVYPLTEIFVVLWKRMVDP